MRVRLRNHSAFDGLSRVAISPCLAYLGDGTARTAPFTIDTDFPGACPTSADAPAPDAACLTIGTGKSAKAPLYPLYQAMLQLGRSPAYGESSCLVKLRFHDAAGRRDYV